MCTRGQRDREVLRHDEENDYTLKEDRGGVWITVNNISIWILPGPNGVTVSLYPSQKEADYPELAQARASFNDAALAIAGVDL